MILVDFSSIVHRMIHTGVSSIKPSTIDGKFVTNEFIAFTKYLILLDLFNIHREHSSKFGDIVICLDKSDNGYWRKDYYPGYKSSRKKGRDESEVNYSEVFAEIEQLIEQIRNNLPWKVIAVSKAEADDLILILSREFNSNEKILIHSPDKDMIQAQRNSDNVFQWSALTKKWIFPENKHDHMDHWIQEHVCLGDDGDDVPKVVDHTEFSENFLEYLKKNQVKELAPFDFKKSNMSRDLKVELIEKYDIYKLNRKKESTGVKDIYKDIKFGPATLQKKIKEFGSIDKWLDSHPLYRTHYERNFTLVMEEGIPEHIWENTLKTFISSENKYNESLFIEYLKNNRLENLLLELPTVFKFKEELTAENCGW